MVRLPSVLKKIVNYFGLFLSLGLSIYLGYQFYYSDGFEYLQQFSSKQYLLASISIFIYGLSIVVLALMWCIFFKSQKNRNNLLNAYFRTILWKYLPSNTLHFVGRHFYLAKAFKHKTILLNSAMEIAFSVLSALILVVSVLLISDSGMVQNNYINQFQLIWVVIILLVIVTVITFKKKILNFKEFLVINGGYFLAQLLSALSFVFLWFIFVDNGAVDIDQYLQIMMVYSMGWLLGFLAIGAPAGIGVREVFYLALLQPIAGSYGLLLAFLLLSRIVNILTEFVVYLLSFALRKEGYRVEHYGE